MLKAVQHNGGVTVIDLNAADMVLKFEELETAGDYPVQMVYRTPYQYEPLHISVDTRTELLESVEKLGV